MLGAKPPVLRSGFLETRSVWLGSGFLETRSVFWKRGRYGSDAKNRLTIADEVTKAEIYQSRKLRGVLKHVDLEKLQGCETKIRITKSSYLCFSFISMVTAYASLSDLI